MRPLSKSKLIAHRQCPKRMWLEIHRPELREDDAASVSGFAAGHDAGTIARGLYDPRPERIVIEPHFIGFETAFSLTTKLLAGKSPFFEAGFRADGVLAFADVMLPLGRGAWKMVEVKSSTSVKPYHLEDAAIQHYVATQAGVKLQAVALAHIDSTWVYPGDGNYAGLLVETDVTREVASRADEVSGWILDGQITAMRRIEPDIQTGTHCADTFACGFIDYCRAQEPQTAHPIAWLPRVQTKALKAHLNNSDVTELSQVPDDLLNATQQRVKTATLSGKSFFDAKGAAIALKRHKLPAYFLDFETINPAVPLWAGTRPYQQIAFQFSCHRQSRTGVLEHREYLHTSGDDPSASFVASLLAACDAATSAAPIFVYNQGFESARIKELAARFPRQRKALLSLVDRLVDLLPIVQANYYHPSQKGSWSIKCVLPALVPELTYDALDEVQDGGAAQQAFLEIIGPETSEQRKAQRAAQLREYCKLDTLAMVRVREALLSKGAK